MVVTPIVDVVVPLTFTKTLSNFFELSTLFSIFVEGLAKSALYIMIASGLTLIFGLLGVLNFAHGSLTMVGAYLGGLLMVVFAASTTGVVHLAVFFIGVAVIFGLLALLGSAIEISMIRPLYDRSPLYQILLTFGLTLVIDELARIILSFYGIQPITNWQAALGTKPEFLTGPVASGALGIQWLELFEIAFGVLTVAAVWIFLTRTRYGLVVRAGSEDSEMTEALGIDIRRVFTVVFALGVGLAGVAGMLLMWDPAWGASVPLASETLLPAFVVVIVGGLGTFRGTVVAGIIVGIVDAVMTWWFQNAIAFAGLPELTIFLILVIMLILRPQGLFGVQGVVDH